MKKREHQDYLDDIYEAVKEIEQFTEGMTLEQFKNDKKTINAVVRSLEVMGEAVKHIPKSVKDKAPSIPWKMMADMRNKVIHEYFGVDYEIVWMTAKTSIPKLKPKIAELVGK